MPVPPLWSIFFFLMMATLGFGSQVTIPLAASSGVFVLMSRHCLRCSFVLPVARPCLKFSLFLPTTRPCLNFSLFLLHRGPCFKINGLFLFLWPCLKCCVSSYAEALSQMFLSYVMRLCLRRFLLPPMMRPCFKSSVCLHMLRPCVSFFPSCGEALNAFFFFLTRRPCSPCEQQYHVCHIDDQSRDVFLLSL